MNQCPETQSQKQAKPVAKAGRVWQPGLRGGTPEYPISWGRVIRPRPMGCWEGKQILAALLGAKEGRMPSGTFLQSPRPTFPSQMPYSYWAGVGVYSASWGLLQVS